MIAERRTPTDESRDGSHIERCWWAGDDPLYIDYHDREWGFPVARRSPAVREDLPRRIPVRSELADDPRQARSVPRSVRRFRLRARRALRRRDVERLVANAAIVRHRGKIESARNNARRARELVGEFGSLAAYFWRFEPAPRAGPKRLTRECSPRCRRHPSRSRLSKDLKRRGWTFVGPTTIYAFMQAMGLVNDHVHRCAVRERGARRRAPRSSGRAPSG